MFTGPEMSAHSNPEKKHHRKQTKQNQNNESLQFVKNFEHMGNKCSKVRKQIQRQQGDANTV